ncbi:MAG: Laminin sub domain 2 [Pedosphaera sp.]|nr:Laminin sub domain 2 [Pedosphaera sp.]
MNTSTASIARDCSHIGMFVARRIRLSLPISRLAVLAICSAISIQAQEVGYWRFDEKAPGNTCDTTTSAIIDSSGNGHNGTAGIAIPYVAGSPGYGSSSALRFNTNSNDRILVPDAGTSGMFNFAPSQSVTIEAVIRATSSGQGGSGNIISKQGAVAGSPIPGEWISGF